MHSHRACSQVGYHLALCPRLAGKGGGVSSDTFIQRIVFVTCLLARSYIGSGKEPLPCLVPCCQSFVSEVSTFTRCLRQLLQAQPSLAQQQHLPLAHGIASAMARLCSDWLVDYVDCFLVTGFSCVFSGFHPAVTDL